MATIMWLQAMPSVLSGKSTHVDLNFILGRNSHITSPSTFRKNMTRQVCMSAVYTKRLETQWPGYRPIYWHSCILVGEMFAWISLEKTGAQSDELFPHTTTDQTATCSVLKIHRHCSKCWSKHCWPNVVLLNLGEYGFISPWLPWQLTNYWEKVCPRFGTLMFELAWGKIATQFAKRFYSVLDRHSWSAKFLRMAVSAKSRHPWRVLLLSSLVMMFDSQVLAQGKRPFFPVTLRNWKCGYILKPCLHWRVTLYKQHAGWGASSSDKPGAWLAQNIVFSDEGLTKHGAMKHLSYSRYIHGLILVSAFRPWHNWLGN